jgi:hypothetical protein
MHRLIVRNTVMLEHSCLHCILALRDQPAVTRRPGTSPRSCDKHGTSSGS